MSPLAQIWIIAKLEIGRAFFSRRALWVYLLALFPAVIFIGHGIDAKYKRENWKKAVALAVPASIDSLSKGMTADQVLEKLGKPISKRKWDGRHRVESTDSDKVTIESVEMQSMFYFDGSRRIDLRFESGKLTRISKQELVSFEEDRKVYAAVFQYFYLRLASSLDAWESSSIYFAERCWISHCTSGFWHQCVATCCYLVNTVPD